MKDVNNKVLIEINVLGIWQTGILIKLILFCFYETRFFLCLNYKIKNNNK